MRPTGSGKSLFGLLLPTWLTLGLFFLVPLAVIFVLSFGRGDSMGGYEPIDDLWKYFRSGDFIENYTRSFQPQYLRVLWRSVWVALLTTALCLLVGYPVAYYIAVRAGKRWRNLLLMAVVLPFWTSFLIRTYAWKMILRDEGLLNQLLTWAHLTSGPVRMLDTPFAVMIGLVYGELPFMILPLYASLEKLDRTLLEAAGDLGAGAGSTFFRVTWPLSMPGVVAGIVLVFVPSLGQFVVSDLLGGATSPLVGNLVQSQFTGSGTVGDKPFGAAIAFQLTAFVLALLAAYAIYAKRRGGEMAL